MKRKIEHGIVWAHAGRMAYISPLDVNKPPYWTRLPYVPQNNRRIAYKPDPRRYSAWW